jgi:hypothetical protein
MKVILPEAKTYVPGPLRCIYCLSSGLRKEQLSKEHIIPKKLGGKLILHKASCKACERVINQEIETPTLTQMWVAPRTHLGMPTSEKKIALPIGKWNSDSPEFPADMRDANFRFDSTPIGDHPVKIIFPRFAPPGILWGLEPSVDFSLTGISAYTSPSELKPKLSNERQGEFQMFDPSVVCRSVAKIAHSAAVAHFGLNAFRPVLPNVILGKDKYISYLVGGSLRKGKVLSSLHRITLEIRSGYILATVQLFARYGIHPFSVVVGLAGPELSKWQLSLGMRSSPTA